MSTTRIVRLGSSNRDGELQAVSALSNQPILAFCGLGNPNAFFEHVACDGHQVVKTVRFRDHYVYTQGDVDELCRQARAYEAQFLVTTSKDAVKLRELRFDVPCFVIEIDLKFDDETKVLDLVNQAIQKAQFIRSNPK
jgi:tetraacyldisaccharide 4'-kinase